MSNVYTTEKQALLRQKATLEKALEGISSAHSNWKEIATHYQKFSELIVGDSPVDSTLFGLATEAAAAANATQAQVATPAESAGSPARLEAHVRAYMAEVVTIEKECVAVEAGCVEVNRYKRKVDKLSDRAAKADKAKGSDKSKERTHRNLDKLEAERASYATKLEGIIDMMKRANAKFETILHCAMVAFWLQEGATIHSFAERSLMVREHAAQVEDELVALDVANLIKKADPSSQAVPAIEAPPAADSGAEIAPVVAPVATPSSWFTWVLTRCGFRHSMRCVYVLSSLLFLFL